MKHATTTQVKSASPADKPSASPGVPAAPHLRVVPPPGSPSAPGPTSRSAPPETPSIPASRALPEVGVAALHDVTGTEIVLDLGGELVPASLDASVHPAVIAGACARGERVLVEKRGEHIVVLGALRTRPTPGIDVADDYSIEAKRISLRADEELTLRAQTSALVLRAIGEVETYADRIVSRAENVHKIIGRMLRLN